MNDSLKEKLVKIYELAKRGVGGEKENAEKLLSTLLDKYNLSLSDIEVDTLKDRYYKYTSKHSKTLISQIIRNVTNRDEVYILNSYKELTSKVSDYEHLLIQEMIDFHLHNFKQERQQLLDDLIIAYVSKHDLYRESADDVPVSNMSIEDIDGIIRRQNLTKNLSDKTYTKKLEN